jgi:hypothetical protein
MALPTSGVKNFALSTTAEAAFYLVYFSVSGEGTGGTLGVKFTDLLGRQTEAS